MTLQEAKDQVAKDELFEDWTDFFGTMMRDSSTVYRALDKAAKLYAESKWDEACHAQKQSVHSVTPDEPKYIRSKIDNAPKPEFNP